MTHRFKDQDPNFPERTKLGGGLPDRRGERSMDEVRGFSAKISHLLAGLTRRQFTDRDGNRFAFVGAPLGQDLSHLYGLAVIKVSETRVKVTPSVISGMGAYAAVPRIGGESLTVLPAPELNVDGKRWVAVYLEVDPDSEIVWTDGIDAVYAIAEGAGSLIGEPEVRAYATEDAMEAASRPATINADTGETLLSGKYVIPLAWKDEEGVWRQIGYSGPLGVRMCRSGAFIALGPAKGPGVEISPTP